MVLSSVHHYFSTVQYTAILYCDGYITMKLISFCYIDSEKMVQNCNINNKNSAVAKMVAQLRFFRFRVGKGEVVTKCLESMLSQ